MTIADRIITKITRRQPDFIIGDPENPYMLRWWLIPRNPIFNIYLHKFLRSDVDTALHDHMYTNLSILLRGSYIEHTIAAGGVHKRVEYKAGDFKLRLLGSMAHRVELVDTNIFNTCYTLFLCGPRYRQWYFHCPKKGMVHWKDFTAPGRPGEIGKGCDQ